jgi:SAM-dependent methyltransferase
METQLNTLQDTSPSYVLGHSEKELQRLMDQSLVYEELTEQWLRKAGVKSGMRVLDLGSGAGDVAFLAARLVGPSGSVLGIDRSAEAIQRARRRAVAMNIENVEFIQSGIPDISLNESAEAIIGRLVLMYLPDPAAELRRLAEYVVPGGIFVFQEFDFTRTPTSYPRSLLLDQFTFWVLETLRRSGADTDMGLKLRQVFLRAGLPAPQMSLGTRVEGCDDPRIFEFLVQTLRSLMPMAEKFGVATAEEVDIDTLAERLRKDIPEDGVIALPNMVGARAVK